MVYRFNSEIAPVINLRLKIEINCREHFAVMGDKKIEYKIENTWANSLCKLITFAAKEMLGTKLRALYQRKKGRDLFDLYHELTKLDLNAGALIKCYKEYMAFSVNKD